MSKTPSHHPDLIDRTVRSRLLPFFFPLALLWIGCEQENEPATPRNDTPTVVTASITNITPNSAVSGGEVTSQGSSPVTARGVCWSTAENPTVADDNKTVDSSGAGTYRSSMAGLAASTTYNVRAYAKNSTGTSYGAGVTFRTLGSDSGSACSGVPTVAWKGKIYNTVSIGSQCWFRENLDVGTMVWGQSQTDNGMIEKYCYNADSLNCELYGGLYQWGEAMQYAGSQVSQGICPDGWHIPTSAEFQTLSSTVGGDGNALKREDQGTGSDRGTNVSGFSALLAGRRSTAGAYGDVGWLAYWWSSTERDAARARSFCLLSHAYAGPDINDRGWGFSIRCVKD